jgi:hypothetical protein
MTAVEFDPADLAEMRASEAVTSSFIQQPFSVVEIAGGSIALVAVLAVGLVGLPASQPPDPAPSTSVSAAAPPDPSIPKLQSRLETTGSVDRAPRESQPSNAPWRPVDPGPGSETGSTAPSLIAAAAPKETAVAALPAPDTELNPQNPANAIWVQARLGDLGYFSATRNGVWGPASRSALRDFKSMNGLQEDDHWDRETEQRLSSRQAVPVAKTFVGGWAEDIDQCRNGGDHSAPIVISSRGARTAGGGCDFRSVKREAAARWRIQAVCSAGRDSWTANVDLKLDAPKLIWSSERGIATYVRCAKSELDGRTAMPHQVNGGTEFERALNEFVSRIAIRDHP